MKSGERVKKDSFCFHLKCIYTQRKLTINEMQFTTKRDEMITPMMKVDIEHGIYHAALCKSRDCHLESCSRLMRLFLHQSGCRRSGSECTDCHLLGTLTNLHANQCRHLNCPVPQCEQLKQDKQLSVKSLLTDFFNKKSIAKDTKKIRGLHAKSSMETFAPHLDELNVKE
jgi:hypothetical protein